MKKPIITIYFVECYYGVIPNDLAHKESKEGILRKMMLDQNVKGGGKFIQKEEEERHLKPRKEQMFLSFPSKVPQVFFTSEYLLKTIT